MFSRINLNSTNQIFTTFLAGKRGNGFTGEKTLARKAWNPTNIIVFGASGFQTK